MCLFGLDSIRIQSILIYEQTYIFIELKRVLRINYPFVRWTYPGQNLKIRCSRLLQYLRHSASFKIFNLFQNSPGYDICIHISGGYIPGLAAEALNFTGGIGFQCPLVFGWKCIALIVVHSLLGLRITESSPVQILLYSNNWCADISYLKYLFRHKITPVFLRRDTFVSIQIFTKIFQNNVGLRR